MAGLTNWLASSALPRMMVCKMAGTLIAWATALRTRTSLNGFGWPASEVYFSASA